VANFFNLYSDLEAGNSERMRNCAILAGIALVKFVHGRILVRIDLGPFNSTKGNRTEVERLAEFDQYTLINNILTV
jgi:hypothetical protein